ncbi:MAG: hypothetical protein DI535_00765 [Citrobacter freundii]|nr:MAG: hypothetical protein DI535_00765 [Citrobacter freundii]
MTKKHSKPNNFQKVFRRIIHSLNYRDTVVPKPLTKEGAIAYVMNDLKKELNYHLTLIIIGIISLAVFIVGLVILVKAEGSGVLYEPEIYPSAVWSFITGAFNEYEYVRKRKKLNSLQDDMERLPGLDEKVKTFYWDEFLKRFDK